MPEERIIPRIEEAPMLNAKVVSPNPAGERVILPASVQGAVLEYHKRTAEAELNKLQHLYEKGNLTEEQILLLVRQGIIQQPKNIFQLLEEKGLEALIVMIWNFIKNNLRTTVLGVGFVLTQILTHLGLDAPASFNDVLYGIGYVFMFNLADKKISATWIAGSVLTILSLFLTPLSGILGITSNPLVMTSIQLGLQQVVALLLKDQPDLQAIARRTGALPNAALLLVLGLLFSSAITFAQESRCNAIPSSFQVHSRTITVVYDSAYCEKQQAWGIYNHRQGRICLNNSTVIPLEHSLEETFYHELTHCLFEHIGRNDLSRQERLVGRFAHVLMQALATRRYASHDSLLTSK